MAVDHHLLTVGKLQRQHPLREVDLQLVGIDRPQPIFQVVQLGLCDLVEELGIHAS
jgi:hypothetical protein